MDIQRLAADGGEEPKAGRDVRLQAAGDGERGGRDAVRAGEVFVAHLE